MGRVLIGAVVVAIIAILIGYSMKTRYDAEQVAQENKITDLEQQLSRAQDDNARLKRDLAKVQSEEDLLVTENRELSKALAQSQATGKPPTLRLPYPPK